MPISVRPLHQLFVGEVSGVDLTHPLARKDVVAIETAIAERAVLVFRDQRAIDEQSN